MQRQMGFDLDYVDPVTHQAVPWAKAEPSLLKRIQAAPWKLVDTETTGLNPASKEQNFSGKALQRGIDPELRLRVVSVLYPTPVGFPATSPVQVESFDLDQLSEREKHQVCDAVFTNVVVAHNAGFDAYWIRSFTKVVPTLLLDSMLMARVLFPEQPVVMARMCQDENEDYELKAEAEAMFMGGASGWSLAHLAVGRLRKVLPKDMQGPKNWCEPFLTQKAYNYATDDVRVLLELLLSLFELDSPETLLERYYELREQHGPLRIIEPQVWDVVQMRETGMPWSQEEAEAYVLQQWQKVAEQAEKMVELEPSLAKYRTTLADPGSGVTADLKQAIGEAFTSRGLELQMTEKSGAFKIGEKDLRRVKAALTDESKALFDTWVALNKAKKAGGMARDFTGYAKRSKDGRLHPNTGHGPVTGRLASSEPNCQQCPRDQGFRNCVHARAGYSIVSADYSALDMRVGAALAIRAQRQIVEAYMGSRPVANDVLLCISRVLEGRVTFEVARQQELDATVRFEKWKANREAAMEGGKDASRTFWEQYRKLQRTLLLAGFQRCLAEVRVRAEAAGTSEWGSLRDAFDIDGMDIHTWTALDMTGRNPKALFTGLEGDAVATELKKWKKELGDVRQTGKVGNLSLLYAMQAAGLMEAAAKNYNIHWSLEEATDVRSKWLAAYVEIDLWHKWTELNPVETVMIPDKDRGGRYGKKAVYASYTLGERLIYAFGLNAALSYEDQSTGADILGRVMQEFRLHPGVSKTIINQVHDEVLFEVPNDKLDEYCDIIGRVMTDAAEHFLRPYGVKAGCEPEAGAVWLKG
ncbi:DNA polymerase I, thermostable [compost metagenome]